MAVIFHIDLNAFFASAEIAKNSDLVGHPVVVASLSRRAVITTANYEARKYGVKSAMPISQGLKLCPDLIVVEGNYQLYTQLSKEFFQILKRYSLKLEIASIDEAYLDVSEVIRKYERPLDLAWEIQTTIMQELKLGCSIGIAPTKFLAKIASDLKKPMGICIIRKAELAQKVYPLSISHIQGIGKKSSQALLNNNILTIGDFADPNNEQLIRQILGKRAYGLIENARGQGKNKLDYNNTLQSISQSTTTNHDVSDYLEMVQIFKGLALKLSSRAKKHQLKGMLISVSIRYFDFTNQVRSMTLDHYTNDENEIVEVALLLFDRHYNQDKSIRHLGITLGSLKSSVHSIEQLNIFESDAPKKLDIIETLNKQLGENALSYASKLTKGSNKYER